MESRVFCHVNFKTRRTSVSWLSNLTGDHALHHLSAFSYQEEEVTSSSSQYNQEGSSFLLNEEDTHTPTQSVRTAISSVLFTASERFRLSFLLPFRPQDASTCSDYSLRPQLCYTKKTLQSLPSTTFCCFSNVLWARQKIKLGFI